MKITFLGTASGLTVVDRHHSSILVESDESRTLLDCGEGAAASLLKCGLEPNNIDHIVISHTHPDHCSGLPLILQYMHLTNRQTPLKIYLPEGVTRVFELFFRQIYLINEKLTFQYQLDCYSEGSILEAGVLKLSALRNRHLEHYRPYAERYGFTLGSFSINLEAEGKRIYYSGDLKGLEDFQPPSGVDLLIVECTHLLGEDILKIASDKGIPQVVFTHIPPEIKVSEIKYANLTGIFAYDGYQIHL
jgi:ribonuclease BN (tRNA processing enzyme)